MGHTVSITPSEGQKDKTEGLGKPLEKKVSVAYSEHPRNKEPKAGVLLLQTNKLPLASCKYYCGHICCNHPKGNTPPTGFSLS